MKKENSGFTLLEILLFVTLISLVFIAVSYLSTYSLKTTRVAQQKIIATHFVEELQEWLRGQKEVDWGSFLAKAGNPTGLIYCVNSMPADLSGLTSGSGCGSTYGLGTIYKREVTLTKNLTDTQVTISIIVTWKENNNTFTVPISTIFSVWE